MRTNNRSPGERWAALVAGLGLVVVLVGVPVLLVAAFGWPLPRGMPRWRDIYLALGDPSFIPDRFWWGVPVVVGWLAWLQLAGAMVVELVARATRRPAPAVPGLLRPARRLAARWVGSAALVGALVSQRPAVAHAPPAAPPPRTASVAPPAAPPPGWAASSPGLVVAPASAADPPASEQVLAGAPGWVGVAAGPVYIVQPWQTTRDCLWTIAERHLGDPLRWREIWELNRDRPQSFGGALEEPDLILDGWFLELPLDAVGVGTPSAAPPPPQADPAPGGAAGEDGPTTVPEPESPGALPYVPAPSPAPAPSTTTTTTSTTTTTTSTPTTTSVPTTLPSTTLAAPAAPPPSPPASWAPVPTGPAEPGNRPIASVDPWVLRAGMAAALGLPMFALAGWLARLRWGRAVQASRARPGRDVVRPDPDVEPLERAARVIAADQTEEWIDAALRALTAALGEVDLGGVPQLRCVRAGDMGLEVLLSQPFPAAPPGWEAVDGGYVWRLERDVGLDELRRSGADYAVLTPAVVSLGASPEGPILADLEGFGALSVQGDADRVRAFLAGAALELTTASWSQGVELRVYGLEGFGGLEGVACPDGAELVREAASMTRLLAPGPASATSMLGARAAAGPDAEPWYPMVVLVGPDADPAVVEELVALAEQANGVAVAGVLGAVEAEWQLIVAPDGAAVLKPLDMAMLMAGLADPVAPPARDIPRAATASVSAIDEDTTPWAPPATTEETDRASASIAAAPAADDGDGPGWAIPPDPAGGLVVDQGGLDEGAIGMAVGALVAVGESDDVAAPIPLVSPPRSRQGRLRRQGDCEVWVTILGRAPAVSGSADQFRGRRKLSEVLVYLAVYGTDRAIPSGELRTHCWPPQLSSAGPGERPQLREVSPESFHQAMSRLRRGLGEGAKGCHLPPAVDGAYGIGPGVGCDWTLFGALAAAGVDAAGRHEPTRAAAAWREALELVGGEPFADCPSRSYAWADSEHLVTDIRLAVAKVAHDLASLTSDSDPTTALWATQQGLLLLPTQLGLFDAAMAASAALGDVEGIERAFAAKCWACEQLDPDDGVPPETTELYRHLLGRAREANRVRA